MKCPGDGGAQMLAHAETDQPGQEEVVGQTQERVLEQEQMWAPEQNQVLGNAFELVSEQTQTPGGMCVSPGDGVCECGKVTSGTSERGMVTSEIAIGLIPISFIAILLMVITSFMTAYLQAQSVSYAVARNVAIGKSYDASALEVSGANRASIEVAGAGEYVVVTSSVEPFGVLGWLDVRASSTISIPLEPGVSLP